MIIVFRSLKLRPFMKPLPWNSMLLFADIFFRLLVTAIHAFMGQLYYENNGIQAIIGRHENRFVPNKCNVFTHWKSEYLIGPNLVDSNAGGPSNGR